MKSFGCCDLFYTLGVYAESRSSAIGKSINEYFEIHFNNAFNLLE